MAKEQRHKAPEKITKAHVGPLADMPAFPARVTWSVTVREPGSAVDGAPGDEICISGCAESATAAAKMARVVQRAVRRSGLTEPTPIPGDAVPVSSSKNRRAAASK